MAVAVYILCALTSAACAVILLNAFKKKRTGFLLWSGVCFAGLTINNIILFVDGVVLPTVNLYEWRVTGSSIALLVLLSLIYSLVSDAV